MTREKSGLKPAPTVLLMVLALGGLPASAQNAPGAVTLPAVTGPIPVTADSYPLMAADKTQNPIDLSKFGYVEEEFFISGRANVYDLSTDNVLTVKTPNSPYTTRILVRRPANPQRFSGAAVVELGNMARRYDWVMTWSIQHEGFMERGDIWVNLSFAPVSVEALKMFNPTRYAPMAMANPNPQVCPPPTAQGAAATTTPAAPGAPLPTEEGLRWDMISGLGALLKASHPTGFLAGFNVQRVYATAHTGELSTYVVGVHPHANLPNGKPIYDGYMIYRNVGLTRMNNCAPNPANTDPRQIIRNVNVPVIRIIPGQTDAMTTFALRRDDSDAPGDRYRLYEVAGASHADEASYRYIPTREDQMKVGTPPFLAWWPFQNQCDIELPMMALPVMTYAGNAIFANLDRWVKDGVPAPKAARIAIENGGTPQAKVTLDQYGNPVGGVRSTYLDVPSGTYYVSRPGGQLANGVRCVEIGYKVPFDWARMEMLYGNSKGYAAKVAAAADRLAKERWLTESDARTIKGETVTPAVSSR